jgi:lipopolysaccharide transport system ATP-binding protein
LIDEILAVGDEHFRSKCWRRMRDCLSGGASGILVTHDWSAVLKLCEICYVLDRGRIVESGPSERVVRSYLSLAKPEARVDRFSSDNPTAYTARSLHDAEFRFCIDLMDEVPLAFGYSIESFRAGFGWEILLLDSYLPLAASIGRNEVRLRVPRLPLSAGNYYLNLFLTSPKVQGSPRPVEAYDVRGWTYGNPIALTVEGPSRGSPTILPVVWRREDET